MKNALFLGACLVLLLARTHNIPADQSLAGRPHNQLLPTHISDHLFLYAPSLLPFNTQTFLDTMPGPLKHYSEEIEGETWTAAEIIHFNAIYHGLNPQVILLLLEAQGSLLTNPAASIPHHPNPQQPAATAFYFFVQQSSQTLLTAYDGRRFNEAADQILFADGRSLPVPPNLNPGSYAVQAAWATILPLEEWQSWLAGDDPYFRQQYTAWFGDPLLEMESNNLTPTALPTSYILPYSVDHSWHYTGGPHYYGGGVPGCLSGLSCPRPWSSVDLSQPEIIPCPGGYIPLHRWVVAAESGTVIQSSQALVVIAHDGGWRTYYSHMAAADRIPTGSVVYQGQPIGHPSCEVQPGGHTTGVHVHFGIWHSSAGFVNIHDSRLSSWLIQETTHYNGLMIRNDIIRFAQTGRNGNNIANTPYNDDFNTTTLDPKWTWVRENPTHWSFTNPANYLRIITQPKDLWGPRNSAPVLLQPLRPFSNGNIDLRIRLVMSPQADFHQAGIIIYGDDDNYVRLTFIHLGIPAFQLGQEVDGLYQSVEIPAPAGISEFRLRLVKRGPNYEGYYSLDAIVWSPVGTLYHVPITPIAIGLTAANAEEATLIEIPADFGYFTALPVTYTPPTPPPPPPGPYRSYLPAVIR